MSALAKWRETIVENLSDSKVPGYKASYVAFRGQDGGKPSTYCQYGGAPSQINGKYIACEHVC